MTDLKKREKTGNKAMEITGRGIEKALKSYSLNCSFLKLGLIRAAKLVTMRGAIDISGSMSTLRKIN